MVSNINEKLANEELASLDAEYKKLIAIKEKRNAIAALKKELYPEANNTAARIVLEVVPNVMQNSVKSKSPNKRAQIATFAEDYIKLHGATVTRDLVKAIINNGQGELLAGRDNKVVAVSQALGDLKDVFGTDRMRGWFLVNTEPKAPSMDIPDGGVNKDDGINNLFTTSTESKWVATKANTKETDMRRWFGLGDKAAVTEAEKRKPLTRVVRRKNRRVKGSGRSLLVATSLANDTQQ